MTRFKILLCLVILILFALPFAALAQDAEATETPIENSTPLEIPAPQEEAPQEAVTWLEQIAFASMLVTSLVALAKFVPVLNEIPSQRIALGLNLVIWVTFIIAQNAGLSDTFVAYVTDFGKLSDTFMRIITTYLGGAGIYHAAKATHFPFLGKTKAA